MFRAFHAIYAVFTLLLANAPVGAQSVSSDSFPELLRAAPGPVSAPNRTAPGLPAVGIRMTALPGSRLSFVDQIYWRHFARNSALRHWSGPIFKHSVFPRQATHPLTAEFTGRDLSRPQRIDRGVERTHFHYSRASRIEHSTLLERRLRSPRILFRGEPNLGTSETRGYLLCSDNGPCSIEVNATAGSSSVSGILVCAVTDQSSGSCKRTVRIVRP